MVSPQYVSSPASASVESPTSEEGGCPTPLDWRQVLDAFREERRLHQWTIDGRERTAWKFGEGPPVYLLGGFVGDETIFALLAWLLREEHTCVLCDWPELASDPAGDTPQQLSAMAGSVLSLADSLGHESFALHGSSFGCLVGLQMMLDAPERIERGSLQGGFAARRLMVLEKLLLRLSLRSGRAMGHFKLARSIQRQNHRQWFPPFDRTRWEFYEQNMSRTPVREVARYAAVAGQVDLRPRLSEIQTPILIVQSEGDGRISTQAQQELAMWLPQATVECLDHCGSMPHLTHPHRLAKLLRAFRDRTTGGESC